MSKKESFIYQGFLMREAQKEYESASTPSRKRELKHLVKIEETKFDKMLKQYQSEKQKQLFK